MRLENAEVGLSSQPIRLVVQEPHVPLNLPDYNKEPLRTHQPGIEAIIEPEPYTPERTEETWGERLLRNSIPWGWFVVIGIAFFGPIIWSLSQVKESTEKTLHIHVAAKEILETEENEILEGNQLLDRINKTLSDYFKASSVEERAKSVRLPDRVIPLMREYYKDKPIIPVTVESIKLLQPLTLRNGANFWMTGVFLSNGEKQVVTTETLTSGEVLVDWESLVCLQPMNWDDYAQQRPKGTTMDFRVYVEPTVFYSHEFAENKNWVSFLLTAPDSEEFLFGYASTENNSPTAGQIIQMMRMNRGRKTSLILRLKLPEGIQSPRGVIIDKIISPRWLRVDTPDSKGEDPANK